MAEQSELPKEWSKEDLVQIESQLSFPSGKEGIEMALAMNDSNIGMIRTAINSLNLKAGCNVLELGHGNCIHLPEVLDQAAGITYSGLEVSETMHKEAKRLNDKFVAQGPAAFYLYDGKKFPLKSDSFDRVFAVNCIYFWKNPLEILHEIYRVLKTNSSAAIAFAQKDFMEQLPFIGEKFNLYDNDEMVNLIRQSPFALSGIQDFSEEVTSKAGDIVNRKFSVALLDKL